MRTILCLLLALVAVSGCGDGRKKSAGSGGKWLQVAETKDVVFYIDPASISKDGHLRKTWELLDLKRRDSDGVMSIRTLFEYDCKRQRGRGLSGLTYSEPMAEGELLSSSFFSSYDWQDVLPGTADVITLNIVCAN